VNCRLLVLLDNSAACAARLHLAMRLARGLDCHLVGLAPTGLIDLPPGSHTAPLASQAAMALDILRDQAEGATQRFSDECHVCGVTSFEAAIDESEKASAVVRHAHCSDLVLLTQAHRGAPDYQATKELVERVILESARPTLLLPHTGRFEHVGERVLVAWDDSREVTRALADAMPVLSRSKRVELVFWRETALADDPTLRSRLDGVHRWLGLHGVAAHVYTETPHGRLADAVLARAGQMDADLVVMGAYGHPRWSQRVLGGATQDMLAATAIPLLLSH
jgi:nucleotide-binding universal stress UspA family protein